jgi:large subunit ribosomal protein L6
MSRIGKKTIAIPKGVEVRVEGTAVRVKWPKGELSRTFPASIRVTAKDGQIEVQRASDGRQDRALHGLVRNEIQNMITGATQGFQKTLEVSGVGYRAQVEKEAVVLNIGFSHPITFPIPKGISVTVDKQTTITVRGADRYLVGQVAANLRALRHPDPYKAKGIKYTNEVIIRKEGKTGK